MKKYALTSETKIVVKYGVASTLHKIVALRTFSNVVEGDTGGWVESEKNLSQDGLCWIYDDSMVYGTARVYGNAVIKNKSTVSDNATVGGSSLVECNSHIYGDAYVRGNAVIRNNCDIYHNATVYGEVIVEDISIGCHAYIQGDCDFVRIGCSSGDMVLYRTIEPNGVNGIRVAHSKYKGMPFEKVKDMVIKDVRIDHRLTTLNLLEELYKFNCSCINKISLTYQKYILTSETKTVMYLGDKITLYRIKSVKNFGDVKFGDFGGWVQSDFNLSHTGDCWIYDDAMVYGYSRVSDDARIYDNAIVNMYSIISEDACVGNSSKVTNRSYVFGNASIMGDMRLVGYELCNGYWSADLINDTNINTNDENINNENMCDISYKSYIQEESTDKFETLTGEYNQLPSISVENNIDEKITQKENEYDQLETIDEKSPDKISKVIINDDTVSKKTGIYATAVYDDTNSQLPRSHVAHIMKDETFPDLFYYIHAGIGICPCCGAVDDSCVCDPDDDEDYISYTKEEINQILHADGYDVDLFDIGSGLDAESTSILENKVFEKQIREIYKDDIHSDPCDIIAEFAEFLDFVVSDAEMHDNAIMEYLSRALILCVRLQQTYKIPTSDIITSMEERLYQPSSDESIDKLSKVESVEETEVCEHDSDNIKEVVKYALNNLNVNILDIELYESLYDYLQLLMKKLSSETVSPIIERELTEAISNLLALMMVKYTDNSEPIYDILETIFSVEKRGFRYDIVKHEMISCYRYIADINENITRYGFISGFNALFSIVEHCGFNLDRIIRNALTTPFFKQDGV